MMTAFSYACHQSIRIVVELDVYGNKFDNGSKRHFVHTVHRFFMKYLLSGRPTDPYNSSVNARFSETRYSK